MLKKIIRNIAEKSAINSLSYATSFFLYQPELNEKVKEKIVLKKDAKKV